ncbi:phosphofructokinase [Aliidiomarina haloalkalitolerans]|uniref:Phosphofructokinase n=1 Tax=Aliidiomarina haloalkalitolerans TaxID=859059 RepID=A0A432VYQ0_9GAMM|nr:phosphofructokinase [Aliidiomarina haloalkalitolerans]
MQAVPIVCVTMNPAVDLFAVTDTIYADSKSRCDKAQEEPGGGGINVARNIQRLGTNTLVVFPAGGLNGERLQQLLEREGCMFRSVPVASETRQNFAITERTSGAMHHFVFPGPDLSTDELAACRRAILEHQQPPDYLVLSGSIPASVPADFYGELTRSASALGTKVILDSSGRALHGALYQGAYLAKLNRYEFAELGYPTDAPIHELKRQMEEEVGKGTVDVLIVTLARGGALLCSKNGEHYYFMPPPSPIVSHVGAGDSFVSALVFQLQQGNSLREAFRYGVAAASTKVQTEGNQLTDFNKLAAVYAQTDTPQVEA